MKRRFVVKRKSNTKKIVLVSALVFIVVLLGFVFYFSNHYTGFTISENMNESLKQTILYENEAVKQEFNTSSTVLQIREPPKVTGEIINKNKNKRMDFDTPNGPIRLYFDLLNYSEFANEVIDSGNLTIENNLTIPEIMNDTQENNTENLTVENETNVTNETNLTNETDNITIPDNETQDNETQTNSSQTYNITIPNVGNTPNDLNDSNINNNDNGSDSHNSGNNNNNNNNNNNAEGSPSSEETNPQTTSSEGQVITGNVIDNNDEIYISSNISDNVYQNEIRSIATNLDINQVDDITDNSIIPANNFDIKASSLSKDIGDSKIDKKGYKWGYRVKLEDLNFMAKIDVTTNQSITIYDSETLKIGRNLISFKDLVDAMAVPETDESKLPF